MHPSRTLSPFPIIPGGLKDPQIKSVHSIIQAVCEATGRTKSELRSVRKFRPLSRARQMVHWAGCRCTSASLTRIGMALGGQDHKTVYHGFWRIEGMIKTDQIFAQMLDDIIRRAIEIDNEPKAVVLVSELIEREAA